MSFAGTYWACQSLSFDYRHFEASQPRIVGKREFKFSSRRINVTLKCFETHIKSTCIIYYYRKNVKKRKTFWKNLSVLKKPERFEKLSVLRKAEGTFHRLVVIVWWRNSMNADSQLSRKSCWQSFQILPCTLCIQTWLFTKNISRCAVCCMITESNCGGKTSPSFEREYSRCTTTDWIGWYRWIYKLNDIALNRVHDGRYNFSNIDNLFCMM
jgi:hypothetical protein